MLHASYFLAKMEPQAGWASLGAKREATAAAGEGARAILQASWEPLDFSALPAHTRLLNTVRRWLKLPPPKPTDWRVLTVALEQVATGRRGAAVHLPEEMIAGVVGGWAGGLDAQPA